MSLLSPDSRWFKPLLVSLLILLALPLFLFLARVFDGGRDSVWYGRRMPMMGGAVDTSPMMGKAFGYRGGRSWDNSERADTLPTTLEVQPGGDVTAGSGVSGVLAPLPPEESGGVMSAERKVATTASLELRTADLQATLDKIRMLVESKRGYVQNANVTQPRFGERSGTITVRVPAKEFRGTYDALRELAVVVSENEQAADITASIIDTEARLNSKRAERSTLDDLLTRAVKLSDTIEIQDRIAQIQSEIEILEASQRTLENQTAEATIHISLTEDPQIAKDTGEFRSGNIFKRSVNELVTALTRLGSGLIAFAIVGIPVLAFYGFLLWLVYVVVKRAVHRIFERRE